MLLEYTDKEIDDLTSIRKNFEISFRVFQKEMTLMEKIHNESY